MEIIDLDLDNENEMMFKVVIEGTRPGEPLCRLIIEGEDNVYTAMSKTVGLPIAVLIEHIIKNRIQKKAIHLPFSKDIYQPILKKLKKL